MKIFSLTIKFLKRLKFELLKGSRLPVFLGLLGTVLTIMLYNTSSPLLNNIQSRIDNLVYDQRFEFMLEPPPSTEHTIVILNVDQRSLETLGQWPWSRFDLGDIVDQLTKYGALVIGWDFIFPEYERNVAVELKDQIAGGRGQGLEDLLPRLDAVRDIIDGDRYFGDMMQQTDVVLGFSFKPNEVLNYGTLPSPIIKIDNTLSNSLAIANMQGYEGNVDVLQNSARGAGFFDNLPDIDGVIRRSPLILQYQGNLYPSLALEMARLYFFEENFSLETEPVPGTLRREITGIKMGQVFIPTDRFGQVIVPYIGESQLGQAGTYPYISVVDLMNDALTEAEEADLFNSLVLVGATATGMFDLRATPLENIYPGVEVHANILNAILNSAPTFTVESTEAQTESESGLGAMISGLTSTQRDPFPSKPDWEEGAVISILIVSGMFLSFVYPLLGPALLMLSSLTFMMGITALNFKLWGDYNLDISLVIILFLVVLITAIYLTYGFLMEGLNKRAIKGMFDQYVPPAHIDAMLDDPDNYNFDGESKELSVLFADIRNFTTISESLSAVQLKKMLNEFFTPITGIIFDQHGTIDKYVGDMVMAFWGAPIDDENHRQHAVEGALQMLEKVEELKPHFESQGLPEVAIGVGINSGLMNVGDMGSTYRRSYTVLGDAVNLGSRLEMITKVYGVKLLIGEQTYDHLDGYLCRLVDKVQVKGKEQSIRVYEPLCQKKDASEEMIAKVDVYERAHKKYVEQNWDEADKMFRELSENEPDTKLYQVYLERISTLRNEELAEDWDGTFRFTTK
ncbi:MAG: adenylate/guanylate cyclase domain-containing protein [Gammaproteobacteria bacterium]|nr:adenylate/guanylate cyclase domain-containing protein [Gammaproteobacteria bacterium]